MHLISELSDRLGTLTKIVSEDKMIGKKDLSVLESVLFLRAIEQCYGKRKAAEALCTSVDTINKYIENLEQDLGVKLISSDGKGSSLTNEAQRIVDKSSKIKEVLDDIYNIRLENKEIKGEVRVFMSLGYASYLAPQDLSALFDVFPDLVVNSISSLDVSSLNVKDADIILTFEEINSNDVVLISEKNVYCGFFASSEYLAKKGYPVDIDDLVQNHRLITKHDSMLRKIIGDEKFKKAKICFRSNNSMALINAIENNAGICIMPLGFASQGLVCLDNIPCDLKVNYRLYANRNTKDIPRVRTLINFYKEIIDKLINPVPTPKEELVSMLVEEL